MTITGGSGLPKDEIDRMVKEAEAHEMCIRDSDYTIDRGEVTITKTEGGKYTASFKRVDDGKYKLVETLSLIHI